MTTLRDLQLEYFDIADGVVALLAQAQDYRMSPCRPPFRAWQTFPRCSTSASTRRSSWTCARPRCSLPSYHRHRDSPSHAHMRHSGRVHPQSSALRTLVLDGTFKSYDDRRSLASQRGSQREMRVRARGLRWAASGVCTWTSRGPNARATDSSPHEPISFSARPI